jgi:hypothetical protein
MSVRAAAIVTVVLLVVLSGCHEPVREGHGALWDPSETTDTETTGSTDGGSGSSDDAAATVGSDETSSGDPNDSSCPRVRVTVSSDTVLNVRPAPSTDGEPVAKLPSGTVVEVVDLVHGQWVGESDLWFEIVFGEGTGFVFASYAECTFDEPSQLRPDDPPWAWAAGKAFG